MRPFDVFVSAVSSEFEAARSAVASDLRARGLRVSVQEDFRQGESDGTLLHKLHDHVRDCDGFVGIVGERSGAFPTEAEAAPYAAMLEPHGLSHASYTQWEVIFARAYLARDAGRRFTLHLGEGHEPDRAKPPGDDAAAQARFRETVITGPGIDRGTFATADQLGRQVLRHGWPDRSRPPPMHLPRLSLGTLFKGRETFLATLRETLGGASEPAAGAAPRAAAIVDSAVVHGLGGIGKTQAAVEYARAHADEHSATLMVTAKDRASLERELAELSGAVALNLPGTAELPTEQRIAHVLDWLALNPGWFLILDNADTEDARAAVEAVLARLRGGRVLVTSRVANWGAGVKPLAIDVLAPDASRDLLLEGTPHRAKGPDDAAGAEALADDLGHLCLALRQAAAYIERARISFARYREIWRDSAATVNARFGSLGLDYPASVATTWLTSFEQLGEDARFLLGLLAQLSIEPIPRSLLEDHPFEGRDLEWALTELADYAFVTHDGDDAFTLHRLVQQVMRERLVGEGAADDALGAALGWLTHATRETNAQDVNSWPTLEPLLPHAEAALDRGTDGTHGDARAHLLNEFGLLLKAKAQHARAEPMYCRALAMNEASHGPGHSNVAQDLNNLAQLLQATNRLAEAEPLMRRALAIDEANCGPEHPRVARHLSNFAQLLQATNRLTEAELLIYRALAIDEAGYGPEHPRVAIDLNNLAQLLQVTNRLPEAEPLMRRTLAIDEASYGPEHPDVARDLNNLALLLQATNRLTEAEPLMRRMLVILLRFTATTGHSHQHLNAATSNYAGLLHEMGRAEADIHATIGGLYRAEGVTPPSLADGAEPPEQAARPRDPNDSAT